jgi:N utilization substance protein B
MAMSPQKSREVFFQIVFSSAFSDYEEKEMVDFMAKEYFISRKAALDLIEKAKKLMEVQESLDEKIAYYAKGYELDRIPKVEQTILRLALYEMMFCSSVPPKVSIAEAIRLGRKFSTPESSSFLNAVLDAFYKAEIVKEDNPKQNDVPPTTAD